MNKIRKGDEVIVLTGRDKGKRGVVALRKDDSHLVVEGINLVKKHVNPTWQFLTLLRARATASVSSCRLMVSTFVCSSPTALKLRPPKEQ